MYVLIILAERFQRFQHEPAENDEGVSDPRMEDDYSDIEKSLIDGDENDDMDARGKIYNNMI